MDEEQKTDPVDLDVLEQKLATLRGLEKKAPWGEETAEAWHAYNRALRNVAPALLAEIRRLRQEVSDLTAERDALDSELSYCDCSEV